MGPKVLVTGANGYTGNRFCQYLDAKGIPARGMYWEPDGKPKEQFRNIVLVPGDLTDRESLKRALDGIEIVHNIAALYRPTNVPKRTYWEVNVEGVRNIIELAAEAGVKRFVQCSTIGVHGRVENPPAKESAPIKPDDYYQYSKWKGEELCLELSKQLGLAVAVVRPGGIYGPYERRFLKLVRLLQSRRFIMFGNGEVLYHFVHITDLCDAFMLCAEKDEAIGQSYLIADDHAITLNQIVKIMSEELCVEPPTLQLPFFLLYGASVICEFACKAFRVSPPLHRRRAEWFHSVRSFDISKARSELGYNPKVSPETGLKEMIRSFREAGWIS